ncbi:MAG: hypothetical protein ACOC1X_04450 [Promethearchaeota archaeon]
MSQLNVEEHSLEHFERDSQDLRKYRNQDHINELKEIIKKEGFKSVLKVEVIGEDQIEVKSGNYRLDALKELQDEDLNKEEKKRVPDKLQLVKEKNIAFAPGQYKYNSISDQVVDNNIQQTNSPLEKAEAVVIKLAEEGEFEEEVNQEILEQKKSKKGLKLKGDVWDKVKSKIEKLKYQEERNRDIVSGYILLSAGMNSWNTFQKRYLHYLNLPEDLKELTIALDNPTSE